MSNPLVTCVLTTRDRRIYARQTLVYLARQTYKPIEVIVIDAGQKKVREREGWDGNVQHVHVPYETTVGASRAMGARMGVGRIIAQWDDDDWWSSERIAWQVKKLIDTQADVVSTRDFFVYDVAQRCAYVHNSRVRPRWFSGGTTMAWKHVWSDCPTRDITNEEDGFWYRDLEDQKRKIVHWDNLSLYAYVRHVGNGSVTEQRLLKEDYTQQVRTLMGHDVAWYDDLSDIAPVRPAGTDESAVLPIFEPRSVYFGGGGNPAVMRRLTRR